jgi:outer membrane protein assembly factor BamE (lipoprotein component of BamABCDE complex)
MRRTTLTFATLALAAPLLTGCIAGSSSAKLSGTPVGTGTISQIEPGVTTKSWVLATLGEPSKKSNIDMGGGVTEIWRYEWSRRRKSSGWVFPFVVGSSSAEASGTAFVEFDGDIVQRAWRDVSPGHDHDGGDDAVQIIVDDKVQMDEEDEAGDDA